jgi:hypothetical protein
MFGGGGMSTSDISGLANQEAQLNRTNSYSPIYGGMTWSQGPGSGQQYKAGDEFNGNTVVANPSTGELGYMDGLVFKSLPDGGNTANGPWTQTQTLSPFMQSLFGQASDLTGRIGQDMQPFDQSITAPSFDPNFEANQQQQAYNFSKGNMDPQWAIQEQQLKGQMAAQGLHPGDPGYDQAMGQFQNQKQQAYGQALSGSYQTGVQAGATRTATQAAAMQAQIQRALTQSGWTTGQIQQLLGMLPGGPSGQAQPVSLVGPAMQNQLAQQQMQSQFWNNLIGGGAMLGAGALAHSDVEAKEEFADPAPAIEEFLEAAEPSEYSYKPEYKSSPLAGEGRYVSPMAQGLERSTIGRSMVVDTPAGKVVDYGKSFGALLGSLSHLNKKLNSIMGL